MKLNCFIILLFLYIQVNAQAWHDESGPWVIATKGEVWPKPKEKNVLQGFYRLEPNNFNFEITNRQCDILIEAIERYKNLINLEYEAAKKYLLGNLRKSNFIPKDDPNDKGYLSALKIDLNKDCELYPHLTMNESYTLNILNTSNIAVLKSDSIWGVLRGLESFSQLLYPSEDQPGLTLKCQEITDEPKLPHRGLLLDTSRHFVPIKDIYLTLDAMSYNKLNVFHWHITDDNSFPYQSLIYPQLAIKGAYHSTMIYSVNDIQNVIEYARKRGIRVLPEFDTPGHTQSWGLAFPQFLTECYGTDGKPNGKFGPMDPTNQELYSFMQTLLGEVTNRFPDKYIHLGGDEVPFECWKSNPEIQKFMEANNLTNYAKLEEIYIQKILEIANNLNVKSIVWQEVFDNGVEMKPGTVVHVWTGLWPLELERVVNAGFPALLSACWYLDHLSSGGDWLKFYRCDPLGFTRQKEGLMLGGEACMWGEFVDRNNIHSRIWPRASATAERLWSHDIDLESEAEKRLEEHSCRMNKRGVPAQPPNGSGFCVA